MSAWERSSLFGGFKNAILMFTSQLSCSGRVPNCIGGYGESYLFHSCMEKKKEINIFSSLPFLLVLWLSNYDGWNSVECISEITAQLKGIKRKCVLPVVTLNLQRGTSVYKLYVTWSCILIALRYVKCMYESFHLKDYFLLNTSFLCLKQ